MQRDYKQYQQEVAADVATVLRDAGCQPILFIGSGFSKRYAIAPNWEELLRKLADICPLIDKDYAYYKQTYGDLMKIGSVFADAYLEWAWDKGQSKFPAEYFSETFPPDIFLKHTVAELLKDMGPSKGSYGSAELDAEIAALKAMSPHAIVTTNFDELIEPLFPEYERVIGQTILRQPYLSIGEIFKIHGCVSQPSSLVLTKEDYVVFNTDKKYLSAKLLTYFAEHPLVFVGYSATDPNIKSVLYDVDRMIRANFQLIPNIYILEWSTDLTEASYPAHDRVLSVGEDREIRIKSISASSFEWVFKAFSTGSSLEKVNMKLLRALMARTVDLVRKDVPTKRIEVDFQTLEHKMGSGESVATLLGITSLDHASKVNATFPYTLTHVAEQLGFGYWSYANQLIDLVKQQTGFDIKGSDNTYHITMRTGKKSWTNKYSQAIVDLLSKVAKGDDYKLAGDCQVAKDLEVKGAVTKK
jgi:hypothetical protein